MGRFRHFQFGCREEREVREVSCRYIRSTFIFDPLVRGDYLPDLPDLPAAVRGLDWPHDQVVCTRCRVPLDVEGKSVAAGALHSSCPLTEDLRGYVLRAENVFQSVTDGLFRRRRRCGEGVR